MKVSLDKDDLLRYVKRQLDHFFPDDLALDGIDKYMDETLQRSEYCFSAISDPYFRMDGQVYFNHLHSDQYATFLYFLSNTLYGNSADPMLCAKLFYLNKTLHGLNVFYAVELPDIFFLVHPVGTVLGRATYSDYLCVYQNCTVGSNLTLSPVIGEHVTLYCGASIIGRCTVGNNCIIAANSHLINRDLPSGMSYIETPPYHMLRTVPSSIDPMWA